MSKTICIALAATLTLGVVAEAQARGRPGVGARPGAGAGAPGVGVRPGVGVGAPGVGARPGVGVTRVRAGPYRWPAGTSYRRLAVGGVLPRAFLASTYYYAGYAALGLAAPRSGYQWVRYGPDILMVNVATGNVAEARNDVFED